MIASLFPTPDSQHTHVRVLELFAFTFIQKDGEMRIVHFMLESVVELSSVRLLMPPDLRAAEKRAAVAESMKEAFRRCSNNFVVGRRSRGALAIPFFLGLYKYAKASCRFLPFLGV